MLYILLYTPGTHPSTHARTFIYRYMRSRCIEINERRNKAKGGFFLLLTFFLPHRHAIDLLVSPDEAPVDPAGVAALRAGEFYGLDRPSSFARLGALCSLLSKSRCRCCLV